jgi:hypothetical protein
VPRVRGELAAEGSTVTALREPVAAFSRCSDRSHRSITGPSNLSRPGVSGGSPSACVPDVLLGVSNSNRFDSEAARERRGSDSQTVATRKRIQICFGTFTNRTKLTSHSFLRHVGGLKLVVARSPQDGSS